jgi:molybdate transport system substrate-binding protein
MLLVVTGCSAHASDGGRLTVFAAASLTRAFEAEAAAYEQAHPGTDVVLSFAGSQSLVAQVQQGAPADVLATADPATMNAVRGDLRQPSVVFAHNQLAIVTARGNPLHLTSLPDLARHGLKVVLAGPSVPVGKAAAKALARAGVRVTPVSLEDAVTGVVGKVRLGEADAGIAYVTDLGDGVDGVPLAGTATDLAIGPLTDAGRAFVEFVLGPEGQAVLREHRFQ